MAPKTKPWAEKIKFDNLKDRDVKIRGLEANMIICDEMTTFSPSSKNRWDLENGSTINWTPPSSSVSIKEMEAFREAALGTFTSTKAREPEGVVARIEKWQAEDNHYASYGRTITITVSVDVSDRESVSRLQRMLENGSGCVKLMELGSNTIKSSAQIRPEPDLPCIPQGPGAGTW